MSTLRSLAVVPVLVSAASVALASRQSTSEARGQDALREMHAAYKALPSLHVKVKWTAKYSGGMTADDFPLPGPDVIELRMQRPNKIFLAVTSRRLGKPQSYSIVSDGTNLWFWRSWTNTYLQLSAPATLAGLNAALPDDAIGTGDGQSWDADDILDWDLVTNEADLLLSEATASHAPITVTSEKLGDVPVNVVRVKEPAGMPFSLETRLYLSAADHLVRRYEISARGKHPENGRDFTVDMQATYELHTTTPSFTAKDFVFVPPPGAKRVEKRTSSSSTR